MRRAAGRDVVPLLVVVLAVLALGPALLPGYTLIGDQVFVPDQSLLPVDGRARRRAARSVPQDAVVAVLTGPVPGWVLGDGGAASPPCVLLGTGVAPAAARRRARRTRCVAAVVAVWSPYVAERLLLGPLVAAARRRRAAVGPGRRRRRRARATGRRRALAAVVALASLTPTRRAARARGVGPGAAVVVGGAARRARAPGAARRASRSSCRGSCRRCCTRQRAGRRRASTSSPCGPRARGASVLTALGTGGVWNADAVPGSRATLLAPLATLRAARRSPWPGRRAVVEVLGRPVALTLAVASAVGARGGADRAPGRSPGP